MLITSPADERGEECHEECCQSFNNFQWFQRYFAFLTTSQSSPAICSWRLPAIPCAVLIVTVFIWCQLKYAAIITIFYFKASFSAHGQNVWVSSTAFLLIIIKKANCRRVLSLYSVWFWERERGSIVGFTRRSRCVVDGPHQPHESDPGGAQGAPAPLSLHGMVCSPPWCGCGLRSPTSPLMGVWPGHQCGQRCHLKEQQKLSSYSQRENVNGKIFPKNMDHESASISIVFGETLC